MGVFGGISKIGGRDEAPYLSFSTPACTVVAIIYRWITRSQIARAIGLHGRLSSFVSGAIYRLIIDWSCRRAGQFYLRPSENNKKKVYLVRDICMWVRADIRTFSNNTLSSGGRLSDCPPPLTLFYHRSGLIVELPLDNYATGGSSNSPPGGDS